MCTHSEVQVTLVATSSEVVLKNDPEGVGLDDQKDGGLRTEMRLGTSSASLPRTPAAALSAENILPLVEPTQTTASCWLG